MRIFLVVLACFCLTKTTTTTTTTAYIFKHDRPRIIQTKICKGGGASARGCLLSFSFAWSDDRSSISKGQIETEKDAIEVADRAQTYTQRRRRRIIICCGKTVNATRCHIVSFKTKNFEKLPFVQSSSRVFETKKEDRRDAPEREPLSVLVLKSDDPQIRSRVLRRRRCYYVYATEMCVQFFITTTTTTTTIQTYSRRKTRERTRDV